jgi:hypothetical protein
MDSRAIKEIVWDMAYAPISPVERDKWFDEVIDTIDGRAAALSEEGFDTVDELLSAYLEYKSDAEDADSRIQDLEERIRTALKHIDNNGIEEAVACLKME